MIGLEYPTEGFRWKSICRHAGRNFTAPVRHDYGHTASRSDHDDLRAKAGPFVRVDNILVHHADAARRHVLADREGIVGAMDAELRVARTVEEVERARP